MRFLNLIIKQNINGVLHEMALNGKVLKQCEIFGRWSHECGGKHHRQVGGGHLVLSTQLVNSVEREAENDIMQYNDGIQAIMIMILPFLVAAGVTLCITRPSSNT